jgi:integrase/recombinase XerD
MAAAKSLTPDEVQQVLAHIAHSANSQRNRCLFLMSAMAGFRVSELAGLTIADVRNSNGTVKAEVYLSAHRVKHAHARTVFLSSRLQTELANFIAQRN